jgi:succinate dehydrogenase (ubiquinone) cytochrome b560 subunit
MLAPSLNAVSKQSRLQSDSAKFQVLSAKEGQQLLANRRLNRPIAPHLSIYKPQMGSVLSSMMRITGVAYSGSFYIFGIAYLISPYLGWDLSSATIAAAFGSLPWAAKSFIKFAIAWPVVLHCINGIRHLTWDTARGFNNSFIMKTGWAAVGVATLSVSYMVYFMS